MPGGGALVHVGGRDYTPSIDVTLSTNIDEVDSTTTYIGECAPGLATADSDPNWRISKKTVNGTVTSIKYAGTGAFDQRWDQRTSLSYS